jgi:ubiquinone/menaquinone biosynthesis C-methylase UbiE
LEPAEYEYMFHLEDAYWWYVGMRHITEKLLRRDGFTSNASPSSPLRILDAGSGTGGSLQLLKRFGEVTAFDFAPQAAAMYRTREQGRIAVASIDAIPFADNSFDLVTAFDVVCQLPSPGDEQALREICRVVKPGGGVLVRVPAFQFLYGPHDVVLHTSHRYSAQEMSRKLEAAGLKSMRTTYANTFLFPVALVRRLLAKLRHDKAVTDSDVRPVPAPLNALLTAILSTEAPLISRWRLPFGLSLVALARKP